MHDLEDRVTASLRRQAERVTAAPGLARAAHQDGRRLRVRRRLTAAVVCVAALAIGVPVGLNLADVEGTSKTQIAPATTQSPAPRPSTTPKAMVKATIDLAKLPMGEAPRVPWYSDGKIHDRGRDIPVGKVKQGSQVEFIPVAGGYLVSDCCASPDDNPGRTRLIGTDGHVKKTLPEMPIVSADGRRLAWTEPAAANSDRRDLVLADAKTGEHLQKSGDLGIEAPTPVGFARGLVAFGTDTADGGSTNMWNPETGEVTTIKGLQAAQITNGSDLLVAATKVEPETGETTCSAVHDMTVHHLLWQTCDLRLWSLSTDGRYVFGDAGNGDLAPTTVAEATNGHPLLELSRAWISNPTVETDGSMLFQATQAERQALIRCTLDGNCERATETRPVPPGGTAVALPGRPRY